MATIIGRTPEGLEVLPISEGGQPTKYAGSSILPTRDGKQLVCVTPSGIKIVDLDSQQQVGEVAEEGVAFAALSPTNAFLVTCQRPTKVEDGKLPKNLKVWDLASGQCVLALSQKSVNKDTWPPLHWSAGDASVAHMVTNTVHVYSRADGFAAYRKITIKGVGGIALSPAPGPHPPLAAFIPETKGGPASAGLYSSQPGPAEGGASEPTASLRKSFFRTQGAHLMWNCSGSACLVLSYADFDATNQSYYGEQKLHYLPADPARADALCMVPLPKEGPVHDVQWSPTGDFFVAVAGFMPARVTLFDATCKPIYDLGSGPYNIVRWNPFGRFFAICGFGNLPGDIVLYDKKTSGTCKQMGAVRAPAVTLEWSPDGRSLLTATTAPRMRVDNNIKVYTYFGEQTLCRPFSPALYEASWRPAPPGTYQDRPQSPERVAAAAKGGVAPAAGLGGPSYVPPHQRNAGATATAPTSFSLARDKDDKPGKIKASPPGAIVQGLPQRAHRLPPGAEFVAGSAGGAPKNAKRRAKKKKAAGAEGGGSEDGEGAEGAEGGEEEAQVQAAAAAMAAASVSGAGTAGGPDAGTGGPGPAPGPGGEDGPEEARQKRIRALQKKHRQLAALKEKAAKDGEASLQPEQREKLRAEQALLDELAALGAQP